MYWAHLSRSGLASEELMIQWAVRWVELGLEENAAIGYGFKRGRTFVGETEADEKLKGKMVMLFLNCK